MTEWWRQLRGRPFYWALDGTHPAADLVMLASVIERPDDARPVRAAQLALREAAPVTAQVARLADDVPTWQRYAGKAWRLRGLAELGVEGDDERIAEALDAVLDTALPPDNALSLPLLAHVGAALGFADEGRVQRLFAAMGDEMSDEPRWLGLALQAVAAHPAPDVALRDALSQRMASLSPEALPHAAQFGVPNYDQPDALSVARAALQAGLRAPWLAAWVDVVLHAQDEAGLWRMARQRPTPDLPPWPEEAEGRPSRLITARALYVLRAWFGE
ncbi:MAG: hypothetical protein KDD73_11685 [Anaerolineales bacterium]|nr:hypothetical protein [Anaerolineales bacterium]